MTGKAYNQDLILTNKFEGILLYLQRVLRPIWDLRLTRLPQTGIYTNQLSNVPLMMTARKKLENLRNFLELRQASLLAITPSAREALMRLRHEAKHSMHSFSETVEMPGATALEAMDPYISENMAAAIKKKWEACLIFVQRCLDVINFLRVTNFDQEGDRQAIENFSHMVTMIVKDRRDGANFLKELARTAFSDLVKDGASQEGLVDLEELQRVEKLAKQIERVEAGSAKNQFLRKMYQYYTRASLDIDARNIRQKDARLYRNAEREHKRLKQNAERLQE